VADLVARLRHDGLVEVELVADVCRNLDLDRGNTGVWLALVLDGRSLSLPRLEYVYARVDRDATLAAYPADDFLWTTGWDGHRAELSVRAGEHAALAAVGQLQRYKDAPRPEARKDWVGRLRLELRLEL
jgi:hypothetical protein